VRRHPPVWRWLGLRVVRVNTHATVGFKVSLSHAVFEFT
jgi:hypothetical protein